MATSEDKSSGPSRLAPAVSAPDATSDSAPPEREWPPGPGPLRAFAVIGALVVVFWWLGHKVQDGRDDVIAKVGRIEVTARLLERPPEFPARGSYLYTYVLKYQVIIVHRQDPQGKYKLKPGDVIFVGHYKPWLPRSEIKDDSWGDSPLGGKLAQFITGEADRIALDYELQDLAPAGVLDYCYPQGVNRFFAIWTNPTTL